MKKIFLMALSVLFFGTVANAKGNGAEGDAKTPNGVEAVDLGLSVKWANMNVGAQKDSGFGSYFAWGEIKPKDDSAGALRRCSPCHLGWRLAHAHRR